MSASSDITLGPRALAMFGAPEFDESLLAGDWNNEYLADSDEQSPPADFTDFTDLASMNSYHSFHNTPADHQKANASPSVNFASMDVDTSPESTKSSQDSMPESPSSKRTGGSASTNASAFTSTEAVLHDRAETGWNAKGMPGMEVPFNGTITMNEIENRNSALFDSHYPSRSTTQNSPMSNSSPVDTIEQFSHASNLGLPEGSSPSDGYEFRGCDKRYNLSQSMGDLNTNAAREFSQSQSASPSAQSPINHQFHGLPTMVQPSARWAGSYEVDMPSSHHPGMMEQQFNIANPMPSLGYPGLMYQPPYRFIIPATPTKSRVETQIQIKLRLSPLPPGIKRIHFPKRTISKPKNFSKPPFEPCADTLELHTSLVCTSAMQNPDFRQKALARALKAAVYRNANGTLAEEISPPDDALKGQDGGEVLICQGCRTREQKRAGRKKKNTKSGSEEASWQSLEMHRVVVFNCNEVEIWKEPKFNDPNPENHLFSIDAPMRLACYCRHHSEKLGFQVIFTITDFKGNFIAQNLSHSIMITDDHKATQAYSPPSRSPQAPEFELPGTAASPVDNMMVAASPSDHATVKLSTPTPRGLSRPASPSSISGPSSKKRKSSGSGISSKLPGSLTMTRLPPFPPPAVSQQFNQAMDNSVSSGASHYPATPGSFNSTPEQAMSAFHPATTNSFGPPPTPSYDQPLFPDTHRTPSLEQLSMAMFPVSSSQQQSRAPTPNGLRPKSNPTAAQANNQLAQMMRNSIYAEAPASSGLPAQEPPTIYKIIPSEGPKAGGIEVTVLGSGFHQGMEVMFGDKQAATTTFWGESSLVCLLPPSPAAGPVLVTLKSTPNNGSPRFFQYRDDDEQQLIRTALSVLGGKLSGNILDVAHLARRIIDTQRGDWRTSMAPEDQGGSSYNPRDGKYENQLLKVLELIDLDDSPHKARLNLRRSTGQTMLHLACSLGMQRFVAGLLARGANPDLRDKGGYTPLHMASLNNHPEIVQRLIACRADPTLRTLSGLTPADVAGSAAVVDALRRARSRSVESLHSRASSNTSIKSLWGPSSRIETTTGEALRKDIGTEEESPEYSSEYGSLDVEDSDSDSVEDPWLDMRRGSTHESSLTDSGTPAADAAGGIGYPAAAVTAFKEQFAAQIQQIQQSMALHLQNLPQFPYLPQMPNMPPLPEYQAAMFQRLASMVPTIGGPRPGSAGEHPAPKDLDGKWWALPSLIAGSSAPPTAPPPAYEEIYPLGSDHAADADTKQASAAQAAAEAEADLKCAALYDSQQTSEILTEGKGEGSLSLSQQRRVESSSQDEAESSSGAESSYEGEGEKSQQTLPAMLQIGRKNAITKEQQQNLRRAHAERVKRLSRDRNLFFIWIPLLVIIIFAMLYNRLPGLISTVQNLFPSGLGNGLRQAQEQGALGGFVEAVQVHGRAVEKL